MDCSKDPCDDFYEYACGNYRGASVLSMMNADVSAAVLSLLRTASVPEQHESAIEKAVGMWKACLDAPKEERAAEEILALRKFAGSVELDLMSSSDSRRTVGSHALQLSLQYGLHAFIAAEFRSLMLQNRKLVLQVSVAGSDKVWFGERKRMEYGERVSFYTAVVTRYAPDAPIEQARAAVSQVNALEDEVEEFLSATPDNTKGTAKYVLVKEIPKSSDMRTYEMWSQAVVQYTEGHYSGEDTAYVWLDARRLLSLLETPNRRLAFRHLLAWSVLRQLVGFGRSSPTFQELGQAAIEGLCTDMVARVMEPPLMAPVLLKGVLAKVEAMFSNLKAALEQQVRHNPSFDPVWVQLTLDRLRDMQLRSGFPHHMRSEEDMNRHYSEFPESRRGSSFWENWLQAARIRLRALVLCNSSDLPFETADAMAYYGPVVNTVFLPAGIIRGPLFFGEAPPAFNYGALGGASGWNITDLEPSEYMADFVASVVSYAAYKALPVSEHRTLGSLALTPDQLFFVARCTIWCAARGVPSRDSGYSGYASKRARCNVPAMNTPGFEVAFACPPGSRMNPATKCRF
ncbi:neprilysin-1-like [Haemaphysalis longicornis]